MSEQSFFKIIAGSVLK